MTKTAALLTLSFTLSFVAGCHQDAPTPAPVTGPKATATRPTNEHPDPNNQDCAAIKDPAQAENCKLWKSVEADRKKHNSDNVVKHSPGSIQQP